MLTSSCLDTSLLQQLLLLLRSVVAAATLWSQQVFLKPPHVRAVPVHARCPQGGGLVALTQWRPLLAMRRITATG